MPSKLDPHVVTIEYWLAAEPQLTALAILGRLIEKHPEQFGMKQHSIVQRLLKALRKKVAETLIAQKPPRTTTTAAPSTGPVDGSGYHGPGRMTHNREHSVMRQCRSHFGIRTDRLDRAWLREFLAISERIFGP